VLFANIVGFTSLPATHEPTEIILFLNGLSTRFNIAATPWHREVQDHWGWLYGCVERR
jgi:hypothetical protein